MLAEKTTIIMETAYEGTVSGEPIKNVEVARIVIDFTVTLKEVEDIVDTLGSAFMDPARFAIHLNTTNI